MYRLNSRTPQLNRKRGQEVLCRCAELCLVTGGTRLGCRGEWRWCELSGHWAHLCQLTSLNTLAQGFPVHLQRHLKHVQGAVPRVLVTAIVEELELGHVEREVDLRDAPIGAYHLAQPRSGTLHRVAMHLPTGVLPCAVVDSSVLIPFFTEPVFDTTRCAGQEMVRPNIWGCALMPSRQRPAYMGVAI